jgi:hypothetical protein
MARHRKKKKKPDLSLQVLEEIQVTEAEALTDALKAVIALPDLQAILFGVALKTAPGKRPGVMVEFEDGNVDYRFTLQFSPSVAGASSPPTVG